MLEDDSVFEAGRVVVISTAASAPREIEIEFFRRQHGRCVIKFRGIDTISEAERYIGSELKVPADRLPAVAEGAFYTFQLRGCGVFDVDGEYIGRIIEPRKQRPAGLTASANQKAIVLRLLG